MRYAALEDLHSHALVPDGMPAAEHAMNQSLRESVHRALRPPGDSGAFDVHLVEASPRFATGVAQVLGALLLLAVGWRTWRARAPAGEWFAALSFLPLCLLLSPVTWKAHHAVLLPPVLRAGGGRLHALGRGPGGWCPGLWLYYLVCNLASADVVGDRAADFMQAISVVAWADVALVAACVRLLAPGAFAADDPPTQVVE